MHPEGRLTPAAAEAASAAVSADTPIALRDTVEVFAASDGNLYLLRGGARAEFVIRDADEATRWFFDALAAAPQTARSISALLARRGHVIEPAEVAAQLRQLVGLRLAHPVLASSLSDEDGERFARQLPYFDDCAPDGTGAEDMQRALRAATVLILGCGGLGSWTAAALACAGLGRLVLVDDDRVALSNVNRQLLFARADVGQSKVLCARAALRAFDPSLLIDARMRIRSSRELQALLDGVDLVAETADQPSYELSSWVDEVCLACGVAHISAGQFPPTLRVGPLFVPGDGPCHGCMEQTAREQPPLRQLADHRRRQAATAATLGPASGFVGSMLAMEIVHLTGLCRPATRDCAVLVDLHSLGIRREPIQRHPACACGQR